MDPNKPPPVAFVESAGGGPAGVVEFAKLNPSCLDGAGVVEPNGAEVAAPPNVFAGLFKFPNKLPPSELPRGLVGAAPVCLFPKLNEGVEVPLGALVVLLPNNPPPDG